LDEAAGFGGELPLGLNTAMAAVVASIPVSPKFYDRFASASVCATNAFA
jgi:hypothetical protein